MNPIFEDKNPDNPEFGDTDFSEQIFGSNEGYISLPFYCVLKTRPPAPDPPELGRIKKVHVIMNLLSGTTHVKDGYTVGLAPKTSEIKIEHCHGIEEAFWGDTSRQILPYDVKDTVQDQVSSYTKNFTQIPNQIQTMAFPFPLSAIECKKPFSHNLDPRISTGVYTGLYIRACVDWIDNVKASAGKDFFEITSSPTIGVVEEMDSIPLLRLLLLQTTLLPLLQPLLALLAVI